MELGKRALLETMLLVWLLVHKPEKKRAAEGGLLSMAVPSIASALQEDKGSIGAALTELVSELSARGSIRFVKLKNGKDSRRIQLTPTGKKMALEAIGVTGLPTRSKVDWSWAKKALLLKTLGLDLGTHQKNAGNTTQIAGWLLNRHYKLKKDLPTSLLLLELVGRALGHNVPSRLTPGLALLWMIPEEWDSRAFAEHVLDAARQSKTGRWLDDRVFIAHAWKGVESRYPQMTYQDFQRRLIEAHKGGLIRLVRADLVAALPRDDVKASETDDSNSTYHFVRIDSPRKEGRS
ncbi:MAG: hypothetical protein IPK82_07910 [Polyangiaceae bacterium]|nr:hypothetical protein [Polyangiaceae bacterium]